MRVQKVKTMSSLAARGRHNFREQDTPNADIDRCNLNQFDGAKSTDELLKAVSDLLPDKRRKDAVIGLEYLITASPEHFGDWMNDKNFGEDYFKDAIAWLEAKHGKANVVCKTVHLDESTPHLAAFVVPITADGRLSAKDFVGGSATLTKMQTAFASEVGAKHGLARGTERSKAVHQDAAKIQPMTVERLALRKQVKALSDEVARLTKNAGDSSQALAALQKALDVAQKRYERSQATTVKFMHELNAASAELKKLKASTQLDAPEKPSKQAQDAFNETWQGIEQADAKRVATGSLVALCGNQAVYHMGRGIHVMRTFASNEVLPKPAELKKGGIAR